MTININYVRQLNMCNILKSEYNSLNFLYDINVW